MAYPFRYMNSQRCVPTGVLGSQCDILKQTMAFGAVFAANFFNGLNTSAWTGWVFFAIFIGDVLLCVYTVSCSANL